MKIKLENKPFHMSKHERYFESFFLYIYYLLEKKKENEFFYY
jgi:hypothetical protein